MGNRNKHSTYSTYWKFQKAVVANGNYFKLHFDVLHVCTCTVKSIKYTDVNEKKINTFSI